LIVVVLVYLSTVSLSNTFLASAAGLAATSFGVKLHLLSSSYLRLCKF
jgi:hypothetical protein